MSEMLGSLSNCSSGPRPKISSRISRASRSRSAKLRGTASLLMELRISTSTSSRAVSLLVRPSFSRSRRSRILRWRSALTCWYSLRSKVCRFAIISLHRFEQRPGRALNVVVILREDRGQATESARDLGTILLHQRHAPIDRCGHSKILIGNLPQQARARSGLRVGFVEAGYLAEPVQDQLHTFTPGILSQELDDPRRAPQRCYIGVRNQQNGFRQITHQAGGGVEPGGNIHHEVAEMAHQHFKQPRVFGPGGIMRLGVAGAGQKLQSARMSYHEALEQGLIQAMQISDCIADGEGRSHVQV